MANSLGGPDRPAENSDPWYAAREVYDLFIEGEIAKRHMDDRGVLPDGTALDGLVLGRYLGTWTLLVANTYPGMPITITQDAQLNISRGTPTGSVAVVQTITSHNTVIWREKPRAIGNWGLWRTLMDDRAVGKARTFPALTADSKLEELPSGFHPLTYTTVATALGLPPRLGTLEVREIFPTIKVMTFRTDYGEVIGSSGAYEVWMRGMDADRNWLPKFDRIFSSAGNNSISNTNGPIYAPQAALWYEGGIKVFGKDADTPVRPYSTMKSFALLTARKYVNDAMLDNIVTIKAEDTSPGGSGGISFEVGDQITFRDLFYGMMLPSSNWCTHVVARAVGEMLPGTGPGYDRFMVDMRNSAESMGWQGYVISTPSGIGSSNRLSANMLCEVARNLYGDSTARVFMSTMSRTIEILGPNPRSQDIVQNFDPMGGEVQFPEFKYGKGGSLDSTYNCYVMGLEDRTGGFHYLSVLGSNSAQRGKDMRQMIDIAFNELDRKFLI